MSDGPTSVFAVQSKDQYTTYDVELTFRDRVLGGLPGDPHLMRGWLTRSATQSAQRQAGSNKEAIRDALIHADMIATIEKLGYDASELKEIEDLDALEEKAIELMGQQKVTRFARDKSGSLCVESRAVKSMLKENASIVFPTAFFSKETGEELPTQNTRIGKGLKSFLAERVFVEPHLIPLGRPEPDEIYSKVTHGPNGASLGLHEAVDEAVIQFQVKALRDMLEPLTWAAILTSAELNGLGACRSMGFGTFAVTRFDKITASKPARKLKAA